MLHEIVLYKFSSDIYVDVGVNRSRNRISRKVLAQLCVCMLVCPVLTSACLGGHSDTVVELLDRNANVALPNASGLYPLLCAATAGDWQVVDALLAIRQATSQLRYVDKNGRTALSIAAAAGHLTIIELLLSKGYCFF